MEDAVQRASSNDVLQLATDVGPVPMQVGAVLVLDGPPSLDRAAVRAAIEERSRAVPRLRQRLIAAPIGCGRPVWVTDEGFDIGRHVDAVPWPDPGDEEALLAVAGERVTRRLPDDRPLWAATLVTGPDRQALVVVFHHVLADGIGGLAVLAHLVDGAARPVDVPITGRPTTRALFVDAWRSRLRALASARSSWASLRSARAELGQARGVRAARCSLNRPTSDRRTFDVVRVPLAPVVDVAHRDGATVNDVVLTAVAGALRATLDDRDERPPAALVVSVPVSARRTSDADTLGNQVGVRPVAVPVEGPPLERLRAVAARSSRPAAAAGASTALVAPAFRLLATLGLFRWFIERQRLVHTFVTNLKGPEARLTFLDHEIAAVVPLTSVAGNVTVAFAVLSYAGTLGVTVVADPVTCPDHRAVARHLQAELDLLVRAPAPV